MKSHCLAEYSAISAKEPGEYLVFRRLSLTYFQRKQNFHFIHDHKTNLALKIFFFCAINF